MHLQSSYFLNGAMYETELKKKKDFEGVEWEIL